MNKRTIRAEHDIVINIYKLKKNAMTEILFKNN